MARTFLFALLLALGITYVPTSGGDAGRRDVLANYEVVNPSPEQLAKIGDRFEIAHRVGERYHVVVPRSQDASFRELAGSTARLLESDISAALRAELQSYRSNRLSDQPRYHNLSEVHLWMQNLEGAFPKLAKAIRYGTSAEGRALVALRVTGDATGPENKPALMITAATHGDEVITTEVLMEIVNHLINGYGTDPRLSKIVNDHDLYFIPVVNADGFAAVERYDSGRDPNRSYPFPGNEKAQPTASISAIMGFFASKKIVGSIDFHAYGELVMYPWAYTRSSVDPNAELSFRTLTASMSEVNGYTHGAVARVLYTAQGSSADYYYWKKGVVALAIEIGRRKAPPPAQIPAYVTSQLESTWRFIESFR
jgi:hypothetical protein